jgi:hypothetical protein
MLFLFLFFPFVEKKIKGSPWAHAGFGTHSPTAGTGRTVSYGAKLLGALRRTTHEQPRACTLNSRQPSAPRKGVARKLWLQLS